MPQNNTRDFANDLATELNDFLQRYAQVGSSEGFEPEADAGNVFGPRASNEFTDGDLRSGYVKYVCPHYGSIYVQLASGGTVICSSALDGSDDYGASDKSLPPADSNVLVYVDRQTNSGTVVCTTPLPQPIEDDAFCDFIFPGSGVGFYSSPHYKDFLSGQDTAGHVLPFSGDYPMDGLPGDKTTMAGTGVGWHVDNDLAFMRASEVCGVFFFREDGHTRISGESLSQESTGVSVESGIAVFECYAEAGGSIYPWEALGFASYNNPQPEWTEYRGPEALLSGEGYAPLEPADQYIDMVPISRIEVYGGYLGQGHLEIISTPIPAEDGSLSINTLENPVPRNGLIREQKMMDGTYLLESSRQLFLAKTADVPVVRRTAERSVLEDGQSYNYSGVAPAGEDPLPHIVKQIDADTPEDAVFAVEDVYAYASGWQGLNAAVYNPNVEIDYRPRQSSVGPDFDLSQKDNVGLPPAEQVVIDGRYGEVDIYRILSLISILPDGSIALRNGLGSEIRLTQGGVEISGTTVQISSAKTTSIMGGGVSLRGNKYAELVSSNGNLRLKAERDLHLLSGNSGRGGTLIENRGVGVAVDWNETPDDNVSNGITFKAAESFVNTLSQRIFLRTGVGDVEQGFISIDANKSNLYMQARNHLRYANFAYFDFYGDTPSNIRGVNVYYRNYAILNGALAVKGTALITGSVQAGRGYTTAAGHYASPNSERFRGLVGVENSVGLIEGNFASADRNRETVKDFGRTVLDGLEAWEDEGRPLNSETVTRTSFGFPTSTGYGASSVVMRQPYWQKALADYTTEWSEPAVSYRNNPTRPWPGAETWEEEDSMIISDEEFRYFNVNSQEPLDPTVEKNRETYEEGSLPNVKRVSIAEGFRSLSNY